MSANQHDDRDADADPERTQQDMSRRDALKIMGTGLAVAGAAGCLREPGEDIRPYAKLPPELRPGQAQLYATSLVLDGFATGVVVETHEGRPTKIDGNPEHPASLGGSNAQQQAAVFGLYDPYRAKSALEAGLPTSWSRAFERLATLPPGPLWLVMPPQSSTLVAEQIARVRERHPGTEVVFHAVADHRHAYRGAELVYGAPLELQLQLAQADVVLALDADALATMPMSLRWARDFATRRRMHAPGDRASRLFVVEPMPTPTGSLADHRLALPAGDVLALVVLLADELRRRGAALPELVPAEARASATRRLDTSGSNLRPWIVALADDLLASRGASAIVVGDRQPPACHAIALWLNAALGNHGRTVALTPPALIDASGGRSLDELAQAIRAGAVGTVVILDANPAYAAPARLDLAGHLEDVPLSVHVSGYFDETSRACKWMLPQAHELEAWGEGRAWDGTLSFAQPMVRPLRRAHSPLEILAALAGDVHPSGHQLVHARFADVGLDAALALGRVAGSAHTPVSATPVAGAALAAALQRELRVGASAGPHLPLELELDLACSPTIHDGRFANYTWLQELPHPVTKQTWGNAALLSPRTAARLRVDDGQVVKLRLGGRELAVPVLAVPGHADGSVTLELGYGRHAIDEPFADGLGASGFALLADDEAARVFAGLNLAPLPRHEKLARTQLAFTDEGRRIALHADVEAWRRDPGFTRDQRGSLPTLLGDQAQEQSPEAHKTLQWAMSIDTMICTGCSSCMIACQAENNVPTVGPDEVRRGREMHWLRIDSYRYDDQVVHQPMLCQHCEKAPCEYVCPVFATAHSPDGLNEMVYNRCIGTRFCSNNCPYKVRRFNWFNYTRGKGTLALQRNPNVTVRERGVMEKCTYCVQRIRAAEIQARMEQREVRAGEVVTACQQACPTGAIQFDALQHAESEMVRRRNELRRYAVLHELGTRPRTTYLAKIRNPNPWLAQAEPG